jgi:hypothetical protein
MKNTERSSFAAAAWDWVFSYRYAWAERAKAAGYPERYAMEALGHNSKAVHRAYSRKAQVRLPSLESYESRQSADPTIPFPGIVVTASAEPLSVASIEGTPETAAGLAAL